MTGEIIDLVSVGAACRPLAQWWQHFMATGDGDLLELERARMGLEGFTQLPGSLGRAMRHLSGLAVTTNPAQLTSDLELLRRVVERATERKSRKSRQRTSSAKLDAAAAGQLALPGFEA